MPIDSSQSPATIGRHHVSRQQLALAFFLVGVQGFGGVTPFARAMLVDRRRWLSAAEFNEIAGLCQILPGPNTLNVAVLVGARFQGALGAFLAVIALMAGPVVLILLLGALYSSFRDMPWVGRAIAGVSAAAAGLVLGTALKMAVPLPRSALSVLAAGAAFVLVGVLQLPLVPVFLVLAPVCVLLAAWERP